MRIIKKYPNRRLYDTGKSAYITVADVLALIRAGEDFQVVDAESGADITRSVLVQIITEQEGGATPIFTTEMLTRFIRFYGDSSQALFGEFLGKNLSLFAEQQKRWMGNPLQFMQEMTDRNLGIWSDMQQRFMDLAMGRSPAADNARTAAPPPDDKKNPNKQ